MDADFPGVEVIQDLEVNCYVKARDKESGSRGTGMTRRLHCDVSSQTLNTVMRRQPRYVHNYACTVLSNRPLRVTFISYLNNF